MSKRSKLRKILSPLFIGSILIILIFVFSPKKEKNILLPNLKDPSQNTYSQSLFVDPLKKSRPEWPEFLLVENSYLLATSPAFIVTPQVLGALIEGFEPEDVQKIIVEYIVEPGDTLWSIADKFGLSLNTVLWANNLNQNSIIQPGQKLIIPPVSGVIYHVKANDTISEIAKTYKGKVEEIIAFNELPKKGDIFVGDILVIPNGVMPAPSIQPQAPASVPLASSYFMCPHSACRITQGLHWYNAIDFGGNCGDPIYAAAAGQIVKVALTSSTSRWAFGGAGNHLTILHPNGVVTMYGHILTSFVNPGDEVSQGRIIALMGGQPRTPGAGMSSGCHLHFGVIGARNPFAK